MSKTDGSILNDYIDRVYGYSIRHTFSREEADELSQEILCTALRQLPTLRDDKRFEPWLWGLAANVTRVFRRKQGRQRAMYSFDSLPDFVQSGERGCGEYAGADEELYGFIRAKIAGLSKAYRDIIVLHYYDGLSCREISVKLGIPEGTVTWRLSEGRSKLKKECDDMNETALKPVAMMIRINGSGDYDGKSKPFPWAYIDDALSQNILYHCYREPRTVEELSKLSGVPAYYIEDAVQNLVRREALKESPKKKYLTTFLIYGEKENSYITDAVAGLGPFAGKFAGVLKDFASAVATSGVRTAGKPLGELVYLYGRMAMDTLNKVWNPLPAVPYRVRYDGREWTYTGHMAGTRVAGGMSTEVSLNLGSEGTYSHYCYQFANFVYRPMLIDTKINVCEMILNGSPLSDKEKEIASELIRDGYLSPGREVLIPSFTRDEKRAFDALAEERFRGVMPEYVEAFERHIDGYRKLFPAHLREEADRAFHFLFVGLFTYLSMAAQEKGLLERPSPTAACDVLIQFK